MRYFEYVYLLCGVMVLVFLVKEQQHLPDGTRVAMLVAIVLFSFMFSFRRSQRIKMDKIREEQMRQLEEEEE